MLRFSKEVWRMHNIQNSKIAADNRIRVFFLILLPFILFGCASSSDSTPPIDIGGSWTGTIQDSIGGAGNFSITISQSGASVTGVWSSTFSNSNFNNGGSTSGTVDGNSVTFILSPSNPRSCPFNAIGTISGNQITGNYAAFNCTGAITGTFSVTRQ